MEKFEMIEQVNRFSLACIDQKFLQKQLWMFQNFFWWNKNKLNHKRKTRRWPL